MAQELIGLRQTMARLGLAEQVSREERALALELLAARQQLASLLEGIQSCATCARGLPGARGVFEGGDCCSSPTHKLFSPDELVALWCSGTRPHHLLSRATKPAGCALRGPRGCALPVAHRPNSCTSYLCPMLSRELHARGDLDHAEALSRSIEERFRRLEALRRERLLDGLIDP